MATPSHSCVIGEPGTTDPLNICIMGQPFPAERLKAALQLYAPESVRVCTFFPQRPFRAGDFSRVRSADVIIRLGFRPGAPTPMGRMFEVFWSWVRRQNPTATVAYCWNGTDVLNHVRDVHNGIIREDVVEKSRGDRHFAVSQWLVDELQSAGIHATSLRVPAKRLCCDDPPRLPDKFTVLTYVPDARFRFYAGPHICEAARRLPDIDFNIVAGRGWWLLKRPANLHFEGWQSDMAKCYSDASVVVRMVQHDGLSKTVEQALTFARHVIHCYKYPGCRYVAYGDTEGLVNTLRELFEAHQQGRLERNWEGWEFSRQHFDDKKDANALVSFLRNGPQ